MKKIKYFLSTVFLIFISVSCSENEIPNKDESVIEVDNSKEKSQFDKYLDKIFVEPYNIKFLYKWKYIESDMNYALVPASFEKSVKIANLIKYLCLEPFDKVAPKSFLKKYFPKMLLLIGSPAYQVNGTIKLGTAEGGLKITLYNVNNLDVNDFVNLNKMYFQTIFHEFSHVLHQNKRFTIDFNKITQDKYVSGAWNSAWEKGKSSLKAGFISDYASKEANEDFVEIIAHYITRSESDWNKIIVKAGIIGGQIIVQKTEIVKKYLLSVWKIDIDKLRNEILSRVSNLDKIDLDKIKL